MWRERRAGSGTLRLEWLLGLLIHGQSMMDGSNGGQRQHVGVNESMSRSGRVRRRAFEVRNLT
jgi:hypothetical protein